MRAVQPVFDKRFAGCAFALGDFVLVMRKNQILAAEMQIKARPRIFMLMALHSMCSRGGLRPTGWPENVAVLRHTRLPEREVGDGFLGVFVALDPLTHPRFVEVELDQLAVVQPQPRYFSMLK